MVLITNSKFIILILARSLMVTGRAVPGPAAVFKAAGESSHVSFEVIRTSLPS
jgi:hypothetical protein